MQIVNYIGTGLVEAFLPRGNRLDFTSISRYSDFLSPGSVF